MSLYDRPVHKAQRPGGRAAPMSKPAPGVPDAGRPIAVRGLHARAAAANVVALQRAAGNRAVSIEVSVQRQPADTLGSPRTMTWERDESSQDDATLSRTTKVEADRWGEVGPARPRVKYHRRVDVSTRDGITAYLRIYVTVYLDSQASLPTTPEEALRTYGAAARGGWDFSAEGDDLVATRDGRWYEVSSATSFQSIATGFPGYAQHALTPGDQEAAILRHLATLPRKPPPPKADWADYATMGADVGTDVAPIISNFKDAVTALTGVNPVTGEKVGIIGRIASAIFAIPIIGNVAKWFGKGGRWLGKGISFLADKIGGSRIGGWLKRKFDKLTGRASRAALKKGVDVAIDERKFSEYIFKEGATHGKDAVFRGLGYGREHSAMLVEQYRKQASQRYASGAYELGKKDQYGQRIDIEITLEGIGGAAGKTSRLRSGWMIRPDGSISLNTPFTGFMP